MKDQKSMNMLISIFKKLCAEEKFELISEILKTADFQKMSEETMIATLRTLNWKREHIFEYENFFGKCKKECLNRGLTLDNLFWGLDRAKHN